jgi:antirestriction protein
MTTTQTSAKIFLTDYASYNNGTQFEFGHWVDLSDFSDADELNDYITNHFQECDEKSPLDEYGSTREEIMITDFEGFPSSFYSESMSFEDLYTYLNLDSDEMLKVAFIMSQGCDLDYAMDHFENVHIQEDTDSAKYELFDMYYPEIDELTNRCFYLTIDYDQFIRENFTSFEHEGTSYLVEDSWNQ